MEIKEKFNLKTKTLVIILIATIMVAISTIFCTVKATVEPKLNTKIQFTGNTYKFPNQDKVRKPYAEGEVGCGIVSIISKRAKHPVYVTGEGWIDIKQIVDGSAVKYIDLKFENLGEGAFNLGLTIDGEYVDVKSENTAVLGYEGGALAIAGEGKTDVIITKKDGEEINALATVVDGGVVLSIPEGAIAGEIDAEATIAEKVKVEADASADVTVDISDGITVTGNVAGIDGNQDAQVKLTVDEKEIASATGNATGSITANKEGITASGNATQRMTLLQKLTLKIKERLGMKVDREHVEVSAGGDVAVNEKEIASADGGLSYTYGDEDPKGSLKVEVLDKEVVKEENRTIKILSTLKKLINRLMKKDVIEQPAQQPEVEMPEEEPEVEMPEEMPEEEPEVEMPEEMPEEEPEVEMPEEEPEVEMPEEKPEEQKLLKGDFNADNKINEDDFNIINNLVVKKIEPENEEIKERLDLTDDGKIDNIDINVFQYIYNIDIYKMLESTGTLDLNLDEKYDKEDSQLLYELVEFANSEKELKDLKNLTKLIKEKLTFKRGDINEDYKINDKDLLKIQEIVDNNAETESEYVKEIADLNCDGKVDNKDSIILFIICCTDLNNDGLIDMQDYEEIEKYVSEEIEYIDYNSDGKYDQGDLPILYELIEFVNRDKELKDLKQLAKAMDAWAAV